MRYALETRLTCWPEMGLLEVGWSFVLIDGKGWWW